MPPLCLSPSIQTSRIANSMLRATTLRPPKRNRFCSTGECSDGDDGEEGQKREREEHEKLMKVGDEGVPRTRGPAFSRLAFIQAYRERQQNPTLAAQPGSSATSIRLGGAQQQQQQQQQQSQPHQAAAVHASAIPAVASAQQAHAVRDSPRHSRAASPAVSVTSGRPHKKPKAHDGMMSDSGSGISATIINTAAQQKKAAKLAAGPGAVGVDVPAAAAAPESQQAALERTERERAALEKKRLQQQQKRAQAQRRKERKKLELEKAQQAGDLQVGTPGSSVAGTPNWQG